ncbi:MAG: hypothetical protein ACOY0T_13510 [Myxococcota bacterium]
MLCKRLLGAVAAAALGLACSENSEAGDVGSGGNAGAPTLARGGSTASGGAGGASGSEGVAGSVAGLGGGGNDADALIVPQHIQVSALPGGNGDFELIALTLQKGPQNAELYAALRNTGTQVACNALVSLELFDKDEQSVAAGLSGMHTKHMYRLTGSSGTIAACVGPGDVTMAAVTDLPAELAVDDIGFVVYRCNYFGLDGVAINGFTISEITSVNSAGGAAYQGTFVNELDIAVTNASVAIFPVNRVGRPLAMATSMGTGEIVPRGSWAFQTNAVTTPGVAYEAYPAAALVK